MLRFDFYESAEGETTVVTFPLGGVAVIDAHPSRSASRPPILNIVAGKTIHFICLTHPHSDHGIDLVPLVQSASGIGAFWHTVSDFDAFFYSISQVENYPSPMQHVIKQMRQQWADFLIDLYAGVAERKIPSHQLRNDLAPQVIDGVEIYCLSPKEEIKNSFIEAYKDRLRGKRVTIPDPNLLSAVLLLKYGNAVVILGADALKMNWEHAFERVRRKNLPKAVLLKVPHHGAANAIRIPPNKKKADYLDLCGPAVKAVLFAGDAKHPSREVYEHLKQKSEVYCLSNGVRNQPPLHNPLAIGIPGARAANPAAICNPCVSFEIDGAGNLTTCAGHSCAACN